MNSNPFLKKVDISHPLKEYPRPQLQRDSFTSLNGLWEYRIIEKNGSSTPWKKILVPFALSTPLSQSKEILLPDQVLWYRKQFVYDASAPCILLNFEAVDQCCTVYLNGIEVGSHRGGYCPFSFDITKYIKENNELMVKVTDASDEGLYAYGKQKLTHGGMWYTPTAGIWGTVWLESLPKHALRNVKITPHWHEKTVTLRMKGDFQQAVITVFAEKTLVHRGVTARKDYEIPLPNAHFWSPEDPFLYTLYIQTEEETVKSYFAMRHFGKMQTADGYTRFTLNGKPYFLNGLLDQGINPYGGYTYPSEEAMVYELKKVKSLGFNMLRKHIKVESRRWYYQCDKLGILVMQDMPSGGHPYDFKRMAVFPNLGFTKQVDDTPKAYADNGRGDKKLRNAYYEELNQMLTVLYNVPCIYSWVIFNEGWGQFDSKSIAEQVKTYDATRLVDAASGWFDQGAGDFDSRHCYFKHFKAKKTDERILLLSEYGGYTYVEKGHSFPDKVYGYKKFSNRPAYNKAVLACIEKEICDNIGKGLSGAIYTELTDVEDECNGLLSADRQVVKVDEKVLRSLNERIQREFLK